MPASGSGRPLKQVRPLGELLAAGLAAFSFLLIGLVWAVPQQTPLILTMFGMGLLLVFLGLRSPALAVTYLLAATFFRLAIPSGTFPVDPFLPAFAGALLSTWLWARFRAPARPTLGAIEAAMGLYVLLNLISASLPHEYSAQARAGDSLSRFILIGTVMPLSMFVVGRFVFRTESAVRQLMWALVMAGAYSAFVSIGQFHFPSLVWPRYIVDSPEWVGRANGVFNQPVVNGLVLIVGFLVAMLIVAHDNEPRILRFVACTVAAASAYAIYLTHTRAVWLSFALVVLVGCVSAKGFRTGFLVTAALMTAAITVNWATFTSSDRAAGGVGSAGEVQDRLNTLATSIWALERKPLLGWGILRFSSVNTDHHQQWSPSTPWERGFGIPSHFDIVGIAVELGVVGLILWVGILYLVIRRVAQAVRRLPEQGIYNRPLAWTALMCLIALITTGLTVDLRFFDFCNIIVWLLAGAVVERLEHAELQAEDRQRRGSSAPAPMPSGAAT